MPRTNFFSRNLRKSRPASKRRELWKPRLERLECRDVPSIAYSVAATGDTLLRFDTSNTTATTDVAITGLLSGEILDSIAFRTQTNQLFGVA
jgi:hypothetical protein